MTETVKFNRFLIPYGDWYTSLTLNSASAPESFLIPYGDWYHTKLIIFFIIFVPYPVRGLIRPKTNVTTHAMIAFLIPYGDWYWLRAKLIAPGVTRSLSRTGIDTIATITRSAIIGFLVPYPVRGLIRLLYSRFHFCLFRVPYPVRGLIQNFKCKTYSSSASGSLSRTGIDTPRHHARNAGRMCSLSRTWIDTSAAVWAGRRSAVP